MLARFHKTAPVAAVLTDSRALVAKTKDGRAVALLPVDWISWTEAFDKALTEVEKRAKAELGATKLEMRMTGTMSAVAKKEMAARGWTVTENVPLDARDRPVAAQAGPEEVAGWTSAAPGGCSWPSPRSTSSATSTGSWWRRSRRC